jgi:hypothetical protein
MTEPDLPFIKPGSENNPETNEVTPPSPDVKNTMPNHEPIEKEDIEAFICPICKKTFNTKDELDLHISKNHGQKREG